MTGRSRSLPPILLRARERGVFSALDVQFSSRLGALFDEKSEAVYWGMALVCRQEERGHVCADLPALESRGLVTEQSGEAIVFPAFPEGMSLDAWTTILRQSRIVGEEIEDAIPSEATPLILDENDRLYLRRNYVDQASLAEALRRRGRAMDHAIDWGLADSRIEELSPGSDSNHNGHDWTQAALRAGLARPLSVITGGPGTGKTTLVVRLLALAIEQALVDGARPPVVKLLAPTGKAAAAMTAAMQRQRTELDVDEEVERALPLGAETIQRVLLGQARRDALGRMNWIPLEADIVVVDEASMVDLAQMRELFSVCENVGRVVLLGDPDQLASIDSGAALAEICSIIPPSMTPPAPPDFAAAARRDGTILPELGDSIVTLRKSHRFASGGAIGRLADAIRVGDPDLALALLDDPELPEIERMDVDSVSDVRHRLVASVLDMQSQIEAATTLEAKLDRLSSRRVLCAHRGGPLGVEALCTVLDDAAAARRNTTSRSGWWAGKLLLVTRNAPEQDLWNGDVGLVEETSFGLRALFSISSGGVRTLSAGRLPAYESGIAMSVHKSQGSEFDVVDLVLGRTSSRLMTRELLYTGATRARARLRIHASEEVIREALSRRVERDSALAEALLRDV